MGTATLAAGASLLVIPALLLFYVGLLFSRRAQTSPEPLMLSVFATFWFSGAFVIATIAMHSILGLFGVLDLSVHRALNYARTAPLALALWALLYYLVFLYTGRRALGVPLAILYAGYFGYLIWYQTTGGPLEISVSDWDVRLSPLEPASSMRATMYALLFGGPLILATIAYGTLFFGVHERTARYRIATVTLSFLVLFACIMGALLLRLEGEPWFPLTYEVPIVIACVGIVLAYRPPRWVRVHWNLRPMEASA